MKIKKAEIKEIVDGDGSLIGGVGIPTNGSDLESNADRTTDVNTRIGKQPFRYDMMGRFGFTLLPFFEGEENQQKTELINDLSKLMFDRYVEIIKFYVKNPNKLKPDYRKVLDGTSDKEKEVNLEYTSKIIQIIEKHFKNAFEEEDLIDENVNQVGEVLVVKDEDKLADKTEPNDIMDKKIEKVAGLIGKLDDKHVEKLINLLEKRNVK